MPKMKTNRSAAKRFKINKKGKVKRARSNKGHILTKKSGKRKRHLRKSAVVPKAEARTLRKLMPYN